MITTIVICCLLSCVNAFSQPLVEISRDQSGPTEDLKMYRGYGYVESGHTMKVVDFIDPLYPTQIHQFEMSCTSMALAFFGDTLYLSDISEITAYDISEPSTPQFLGSYNHDHRFSDLVSRNELVYAFSPDNGMEVFDYTDVSDPILLSTHYCGPTPSEGVFRDTLLFVCSMDRISCFSTANPANPDLLGTIEFSGAKLHLVLRDDYAYVTNDAAGLRVINISDPIEMILVHTVPVDGYCRGVASQGDYLFVTDWWGCVYTVDISDPESAYVASVLELSQEHVGAHDIVVQGEYAYFSNEGDGVQVVDITDPLNLSIVSNFDVPGAVYGIEKRDNFLYLGALTDGLRIVDISDVNNPQEVSSDFITGTAWEIAFHDSLVVVPLIDVYFLDVSDPYSPEVVGIADHIFQDTATTGDLLVGAGVPDVFEISDISNIEQPERLGSIEFAHAPWCVVCRDNYVYMSQQINHPRQPRLQ